MQTTKYNFDVAPRHYVWYTYCVMRRMKDAEALKVVNVLATSLKNPQDVMPL